MLLKCDKGHKYKANYGKFKFGRGCPHCSGRVKISKENVESHLKEEGYELTGDFVNGNIPIEVKCPRGHIWKVVYQKFKQGRRCSHCSGRYRERIKPAIRWNYSKVKDVVESRGYEMVSKEYVNSSTKIDLLCPEGHEIDVYFYHFLKGHGCRYCGYVNGAKNSMLSIEQVDKELREKGFKRTGDYEGVDTPMKMICPNKHTVKIALTNIRKGSGCKYCSFSKGEKAIADTLENTKVSFDREVSFLNEETGTYMYFDFAVLDKNNSIEFMIEYDGQHHFKVVDIFDVSLETYQERDLRKNMFCKENNIPLVRIPHTEYNNIENIISEYLETRVIPKFKDYYYMPEYYKED